MEKGLVIVNTGLGKGKTTASLGAALRASGRGLKVAIFQFIKGRETGEMKAVVHLPGVDFRQMGLGMVRAHKDRAQDREQAQNALVQVRQAVASGEYGMIILDEICVAMHYGLVDVPQVLELIAEKPEKLHLVLTGRYCPEEVIQAADTVTFMEAVKHHLASGLRSQKGIEY